MGTVLAIFGRATVCVRSARGIRAPRFAERQALAPRGAMPEFRQDMFKSAQ